MDLEVGLATVPSNCVTNFEQKIGTMGAREAFISKTSMKTCFPVSEIVSVENNGKYNQ